VQKVDFVFIFDLPERSGDLFRTSPKLSVEDVLLSKIRPQTSDERFVAVTFEIQLELCYKLLFVLYFQPKLTRPALPQAPRKHPK
jgi:hypothetical protein